jgi:hypothetical protein
MTLVLPRDDEVQALAHSLYRNRCAEVGHDEHGFDVQNWVMAERAAMFHKNFVRVTIHPFVTKEKQYLGVKNPRVCRFCRRDASATTFKKVAHAVPQLLGNRSVIAYHECDACNRYFSEVLEDDLGKMLGVNRTLLRIRGTRGIPAYKTRAKTSRMEVKDDVLQVSETAGDRFTRINPEQKQAIFTTETQKFVPLAVYKCFTKIALSLMPEAELAHYGETMKWVMNPDHKHDAWLFKDLSCYRQMTPGPFPDAFGFVELLKRRSVQLDLPYMVLVVGTQNLNFQIYPPLCDLDVHLNGKEIRIPRFPAGFGAGYRYGETAITQMNLSSPNEITVGVTTDMRAESMTKRASAGARHLAPSRPVLHPAEPSSASSLDELLIWGLPGGEGGKCASCPDRGLPASLREVPTGPYLVVGSSSCFVSFSRRSAG